jgi:hypothetical protein
MIPVLEDAERYGRTGWGVRVGVASSAPSSIAGSEEKEKCDS